MSYTAVTVNGQDVTRFVTRFGVLREWSDESVHFSGVFRRGNLMLELDNTNNQFRKGGEVFQGTRNEAPVTITYHPSDPLLNPYLVFSGVIDEGSTENDLETRHIKIVVLDYLKLLDSQVLRLGNQATIDSKYRVLRGGSSRLNKHFIACFLHFFLSQDENKLNKVFNVFTGNNLSNGTYPTINASIESLFPPSDSYYDLDNISALDALNELCRGMNSYLYVESLPDKSQLFVKARPTIAQSQKSIREGNILSFKSQTDGFNKLYNSVSINNSTAYVRQSSIDQYGVRVLNIRSYAPASQALADTYLDYYATPRAEVSFNVKMTNEMLDIKIGDMISVDLPSRPDLTVQGIKGQYFVLSRSVNFSNETIDLRLRGAV